MHSKTMLQPGRLVPHFTIAAMDGATVAYSDIWQRKNLLLVLLPEDQASEDYAGQLRARMPDLTAYDTACVISREDVAGAPRPGAVIADKWGEVHFVAGHETPAKLPTPDELIEWLRYVQMQCPECQGEAK
ncbi:MAG TPA: hypothetical protein VFO14_19975 [Vicinamibacterales bacterium]|nr:hypothetical protein [Vicinamibacterales bacterium]